MAIAAFAEGSAVALSCWCSLGELADKSDLVDKGFPGFPEGKTFRSSIVKRESPSRGK